MHIFICISLVGTKCEASYRTLMFYHAVEPVRGQSHQHPLPLLRGQEEVPRDCRQTLVWHW